MLPVSSLCRVPTGLLHTYIYIFSASICLFIYACNVYKSLSKKRNRKEQSTRRNRWLTKRHILGIPHSHPHFHFHPIKVTANNVAYARCPRLSCHGWLAGCTFDPPSITTSQNHPPRRLPFGLACCMLTTQLHKSVDKTASSAGVLMTLLPVSQESQFQKLSNVKYLYDAPWLELYNMIYKCDLNYFY